MSESVGWISIHRPILKHWIAERDDYFCAWIKILLEVNHETRNLNIGGEIFTCHRTESFNSVNTWASTFGKSWSRQKVRTFFSLLERDEMITMESVGKTTKLTVLNYDVYQTQQPTFNQPSTSPQPASNQPSTTNNKGINKESTKVDKKKPKGAKAHDELVKGVDYPDGWNENLKSLFLDFADSRRQKGKYFTDKAIEQHFNKLKGFNYLEIGKAYQDAIESGWVGIFPKKLNGRGNGPVQNQVNLPSTDELCLQEGVSGDIDKLPF